MPTTFSKPDDPTEGPPTKKRKLDKIVEFTNPYCKNCWKVSDDPLKGDKPVTWKLKSEQPLFCTNCSYDFPEKKDKHNKDIPCKHPECSKWYSTLESMNQHYKEKHSLNPPQHKCTIVIDGVPCSYTNVRKGSVTRHIRIQHKEQWEEINGYKIRGHRCYLCSKPFYDSLELEYHIAVDHNGKEQFPYMSYY